MIIMDLYAQIAEKIIAKQETIIGLVAVEQAKQVAGLQVDWPKQKVTIRGDKRAVIDTLVRRYKELFGQVAVDVCKEAVAKLTAQLPPGQTPESLK